MVRKSGKSCRFSAPRFCYGVILLPLLRFFGLTVGHHVLGGEFHVELDFIVFVGHGHFVLVAPVVHSEDADAADVLAFLEGRGTVTVALPSPKISTRWPSKII